MLANALRPSDSAGHHGRAKGLPVWLGKTEAGFIVWLEKRPKLRAEGDSLQDAMDELSGVVCLALGDYLNQPRA
jgi:hypothetical protein